MKNKIVYFICILFTYISNGQNTTPKKFNSKEKVGAIAFDGNRDNPEFYLCDEKNIMEYYQVNPKYGEGLKSIRLYFEPFLNELNQFIHVQSGLITIRFIINCKGDTDRFRVVGVDENYKSITLTTELKQYVIDTVKKMDKWQPGFYSNQYFDAYYTLSLKIRNGQIVDMLP